MNYASSGLLAAGLSLCLSCAKATAAEQAVPYDPAASQALRDIPVHLVLLNDELKVQLAYAYTSVDPSLLPYYNAPVPGLSTGAGIAAGALGAALGEAIANAAQYERAEKAVVPGYGQLQAARCTLPAASGLADGLERGIRRSTWGATTPVQRLFLDEQQKLDKLVDQNQPRQVLLASYSMSPDFSTVITSVNLSVYSDVLAGAPKRWQARPAWSNLLIVFSEQVTAAPPKSEQDITDLVTAENERFARTPAAQLIAAANDGDPFSRKQALHLVKEHEQYLREARKKKWTPAMTAARNSRHWISNGCAPLSAALEANARELETLLERLYAGELPPALPPKTTIKDMARRSLEPDPTPAGTRKVTAELGNTYLSRRAGDVVVPYNLNTWYSP